LDHLLISQLAPDLPFTYVNSKASQSWTRHMQHEPLTLLALGRYFVFSSEAMYYALLLRTSQNILKLFIQNSALPSCLASGHRLFFSEQGELNTNHFFR
jgi:hypothetical protein